MSDMKRKTKSKGQNTAEYTGSAIESSRRKLLKGALLGGAAGSLAVPSKWSRPIVEWVLLPAHAQTSGSPTPQCRLADPITYDTDQAVNIPPTAVSATVVAIGGGGGGGGGGRGSSANNDIGGSGGEGSAGDTVNMTVAVVGGGSLTLVIGQGGDPGTGGTNSTSAPVGGARAVPAVLVIPLVIRAVTTMKVSAPPTMVVAAVVRVALPTFMEEVSISPPKEVTAVGVVAGVATLPVVRRSVTTVAAVKPAAPVARSRQPEAVPEAPVAMGERARRTRKVRESGRVAMAAPVVVPPTERSAWLVQRARCRLLFVYCPTPRFNA